MSTRNPTGTTVVTIPAHELRDARGYRRPLPGPVVTI